MPANVAVIIAAMTDNRNRTASEIRSVFNKVGGTLSTVAWQFERRGLVLVRADGVDEDELLLVAAEAGADDVERAFDHEAADLETRLGRRWRSRSLCQRRRGGREQRQDAPRSPPRGA